MARPGERLPGALTSRPRDGCAAGAPRLIPAALAPSGLEVLGVLPRAHYDERVPASWRASELLPEARAAWIVGAGGRAFGDALLASREWKGGRGHPVDRLTRRALEDFAAALRREGHSARPLFAWEQRAGRFADFVALARAAGVGAPSRLGLLLHPRFGPWLSLRAIVLTDAPAAATAPAGFDPCCACPAPCTQACPTGAPTPVGFDVAACTRGIRTHPSCRDACAARRACPVGAGHRYLPEVESHHHAAGVRTPHRS